MTVTVGDDDGGEGLDTLPITVEDTTPPEVVVDNGKPVGFAHCLPIELGAWGMSGTDIMTVPCLTLGSNYVYRQKRGSGYGRALIEAVESDARKTKKGVAVLAYDNDFWFMPALFFMRLGYHQVSKQGDAVIIP